METPTGRGWRSWRRILVVAVAIALAAGVYAAGIVLYFAAQHGPAEYIKNPQTNDQLEALVRTASIDPNKGDLVLRVEVRAKGSLLGSDGVSVTRPVSVDVVGATGTASYRYAAGDRISPVEVTIGLSGDVNSYPFDSYHSPFGVVATASPPTGNQPGPAPPTSAPPTRLVFDGTLSGYQVTAKPITMHAEPDLLRLDLSMNRAPLTRAFAILILVLQALLAAAAAALAIVVWTRHRRIEITMMTWLAALLFAIVPLRSAMPGAPAIGALVDELVFFWAVTIIAMSLVSILILWVRRPPKPT
jgi:hypothetical protein